MGKQAATNVTPSQLAQFLDDASVLFDQTAAVRYCARHASAVDFNILNITRRGHFEVTTHQPMLVNLLDPRASHAQGGLFLEKLLTWLEGKIGRQAKMPVPLPRDLFWKVDQGNQIDIRLRHPQLHIIFEIKWNHVESGKQLQTYWQQEIMRVPGKPVLAIFLTKKGKHAFCDDPAFKRCRVAMSYADVKAMLMDAKKGVQAVRVAEALDQYIELLTTIEGHK